jgi:uncharacterized membrane protein YbhN (UPF0104 family)
MMIVFGLAAGHDDLGVKALITIFIASTIGLSLGITPGGWGIVEGISVGLLLLYGLNLGEAISFAVMFRVAVLLLPAALALVSLREILDLEYPDAYE